MTRRLAVLAALGLAGCATPPAASVVLAHAHTADAQPLPDGTTTSVAPSTTTTAVKLSRRAPTETNRTTFPAVSIAGPASAASVGVGYAASPRTLNWPALRRCESGGDYHNRRNPVDRGGYQIDRRTWATVGGTGDPADASPAEQDARALLLYQRRGRTPWPYCGRFL